ncbi:MAG: VOC family protein [Candidatus Rokubacteria bacterium]|nr:VOC family protein [Candidatus Rokubacteria bacterium]
MAVFDHALVYVRHLAAARRDYAALGFTVVPGGAHAGEPTENALVPFADGTYLELIAFRRPATHWLLAVLAGVRLLDVVVQDPLGRRFARRAARGNGLIDLAASVDAVGDLVAAAARGDEVLHGPIPGRRATADGTPIAWELGVPDSDDLPLVIGDLTPRARRASADPSIRHANGARGIEEVVLPVRDVGATAAWYRGVLGVTGRADGAAQVLPLGATRLMLVPAGADSPAGRPSRLVLAADRAARLDVRATHGAVLDLAARP